MSTESIVKHATFAKQMPSAYRRRTKINRLCTNLAESRMQILRDRHAGFCARMSILHKILHAQNHIILQALVLAVYGNYRPTYLLSLQIIQASGVAYSYFFACH